MDKKNYTVKGGEARPLPPLLGSEALTEASASDLRVLLALAELRTADAARLSEVLGLTAAEISASLAFWRGAGAVTVLKEEAGVSPVTAAPVTAAPAAAEKKTAPRRRMELTSLGGEEIAALINEHDLAGLVDAAEQQCGRLFNRTELSILLGLSQELGLDGAYILTLLAYCDSLGDEKKPLRYAERVAFRLCEQGIDTIEALEEYIKEQEALHSVEGWLRRMLGIGARKLTKREEAAFLRWTQTYAYGEEIIGAAYDVTVNVTGTPSVSYMDKILAAWHEKGVRTVGEAEALLASERSVKKPSRSAPKKKETTASSFDVGDFFRRAVDRSYKSTKE